MTLRTSVLGCLLLAAAPALTLAQAVPGQAGSAKPGAKKAKSAAVAASRRVPARALKPSAAVLAPSALAAVEERTPVEEESTHELSDAELEVARAVHQGDMRCELGMAVKVTPMRRPGFFLVTAQNGRLQYRFRMHPVESRTGAVRLEDPQRGAMWLQLGEKSMLMSQKLGRRLADECQSPAQVAYAAVLRANPRPSLLEPLPEAAAPAAE